MALADFKVYFKQVEDQWFEMRSDLSDFEQALKDGFVTEDRLEEFKEEYHALSENYYRLAYVAHLLAIPNRHSKNLSAADIKLAKQLSGIGADADYIAAENEDILKNLRHIMSEIIDEINKSK